MARKDRKRNRKAKKQKQEKSSYGTRILATVGKSWVSTGDILKKVKGCPARAARRVLRGLVKAKQLKSVKVQRERFFAKPGTKSTPPKAEAGNGRAPRTRTRKAKSAGKKASGKAKRRRVNASPVRSVAKPKPKRVRGASGKSGTPVSPPSAVDEVKAVAAATVAGDPPRDMQQLLG